MSHEEIVHMLSTTVGDVSLNRVIVSLHTVQVDQLSMIDSYSDVMYLYKVVKGLSF